MDGVPFTRSSPLSIPAQIAGSRSVGPRLASGALNQVGILLPVATGYDRRWMSNGDGGEFDVRHRAAVNSPCRSTLEGGVARPRSPWAECGRNRRHQLHGRDAETDDEAWAKQFDLHLQQVLAAASVRRGRGERRSVRVGVREPDERVGQEHLRRAVDAKS